MSGLRDHLQAIYDERGTLTAPLVVDDIPSPPLLRTPRRVQRDAAGPGGEARPAATKTASTSQPEEPQ